MSENTTSATGLKIYELRDLKIRNDKGGRYLPPLSYLLLKSKEFPERVYEEDDENHNEGVDCE
jgi:hypothetical protein